MSFTEITSGSFLTEQEQEMAKLTVTAIAQSGQVHLESDGTIYSLPSVAVRKIVDMLDLMAAGQDVDIIPVQGELTVRQAAKFLGISDTCVTELLDNDILEYRECDGQRLVKRESLLEYEFESREMLAAATEITRQSQELGLYD